MTLLHDGLTRLLGKTAVKEATSDPNVADLLRTLRPEVIADPAVLRSSLDDLTQQIMAADSEWERLDCRGDSSAFLQLGPLAERLETLRERAARLPAQIADAERRREAFIKLDSWYEGLCDAVEARLGALLEHPPQDEHERDQQLRALNDLTRLQVRVALRLQAVSTDPRFREPPDALIVLRDDLVTRKNEVDRLRLPGMKPPLPWPPEVVGLFDVLESRPRRPARITSGAGQEAAS